MQDFESSHAGQTLDQAEELSRHHSLTLPARAKRICAYIDDIGMESAAKQDSARKPEKTSDPTVIEGIVKRAIEAHPQAIAECIAEGMETPAVIVGFVMKETRGKADHKAVIEVVKRFVSEHEA